MPYRRSCAACALAAALLLSGCSAVTGSDVESLLRAPQASGETSAVQKALNSALGVTATLKYPASGDFLSPFLFGDWDGDGQDEAAVLYTLDASAGNVYLAILEPTEENGWRVTQTAEGLSSEVESVNTAHLRDENSLQILVGYASAQGDRYMVVYLYTEDGLQIIIKQAYTEMILANLTGGEGTQDLVLALPAEQEGGGLNLQLLTNTEDGFRSAQTLAIGDYSGCAALHAGIGADDGNYLVVDGWTGASGTSLASSIVVYDPETRFLQTYRPAGVANLTKATLRYDAALVSTDLDGNGTIEIPTMIDDGGKISTGMDKRLRFILWRDFAAADETGSHFGVYDRVQLLSGAAGIHARLGAAAHQPGWQRLDGVQPRGYHSLLRTAPDRPRQRNPNPGHRRGTDRSRGVPPHCQHWQPAAAGPRGDLVLWPEH